MPSIEECKRHAEQCLRWADEAPTEQERDTLLEIARLWTTLELSCPPPSEARAMSAQNSERANPDVAQKAD
jgi:hypothetical protein